MKLRVFMTAAIVCLGATLAVADPSTQYAEWGNGPLQVLMTREEAAAWKSVTTDDDAKAFVDLFWARRDPTPGTPVNEFRNEIEIRIAAADKNFTERKVKGSMTDRGRTLILYGAPKRIERAGGATPQNRSSIEHVTLTWVYDGAATKEMFGAAWTQLRFADHLGLNEFKLERPAVDLEAARERMIARSITQPNLTSIRSAAPAAPAAPTAPAVKTELTSDAFKGAIAELKNTQKNAYENKAYPAWGEYVTADGLTFVAIGLYVPKAAGISGDVTYFGIVEDGTGKSVLAFEEASTLAASKDDFFVDKSFLLPGGKHRGYFGLAQNGQVVALTTTDMELAGTLDKDATAISQLILSNNIYPMETSQKPDHPFAFGGVRVVPKADRAFRNSDELWYFFELRNPGIPEAAPAPEGMVEVVPAASEPAAPKVQVKIDVVGTTAEGKPVKMAAPPTEMEAIAMKGVPGHYGIGTAIPLATFKPGDYTFTVKVIDTVKKTSYTLSEKFKVIG